MIDEKLLIINDLKTAFSTSMGSVTVVDDVSLYIKKKETLALVGESGCGKSMTSLSIMQLLPVNGKIMNGEIIFNNHNLVELSDKEMSKVRGNDIAMIFQEPMTSLNPVLTIGDQITEGLLLHRKLSKKEAKDRAVALLKLVGFSRAVEVMKEYPHQLSGGMRQRVMIAMAMSVDPSLLIADEPTTALDVTIQAQILELMQELKEKFDTSILLITHDLGVVAEMADRVVVMYAGEVVEEADALSLFEDPSHPYTQGLIKSVPSLDVQQERLYSIPGTVPAPNEVTVGCRFAPRCAQAWERCSKEKPSLYQRKNGHQVRCFLYELGEGTNYNESGATHS
ncbi:ABC transporter ATP-binding protein [Hazenella sp. IB182357]|uniref:ABC transporter ATP-binding protein n=1 Tax=Polycladospora coralii TaxID=2771432 RepID=A0A926RSX3_9BACL|nr:ABC transporter ATP-binding protein [Polycladospora coralii]MBD1370888.1 ABC transporter ATP-binding protein [Polycladospora coralii]MBS7529827.1 ABC transporter ATP-binding protein [Polycladospora coralii]